MRPSPITSDHASAAHEHRWPITSDHASTCPEGSSSDSHHQRFQRGTTVLPILHSLRRNRYRQTDSRGRDGQSEQAKESYATICDTTCVAGGEVARVGVLISNSGRDRSGTSRESAHVPCTQRQPYLDNIRVLFLGFLSDLGFFFFCLFVGLSVLVASWWCCISVAVGAIVGVLVTISMLLSFVEASRVAAVASG